MQYTVHLKQFRRGSILIEAENDVFAAEEAEDLRLNEINWDPEFETEVLDVEESGDA